MSDPIPINTKQLSNNQVERILSTLLVAILSVTITLLLNPTPRVAKGVIYEEAAAWCQLRISELPPGDGNRKVFEQALQDIEKRNVRWSIDDPRGIYYTLMVDFAKAWQNRSQRVVVRTNVEPVVPKVKFSGMDLRT